MRKFKVLKAKHLKLGKKGENIACRLLKNKNYDILLRNFKSSKGEVDIIARDGSILCFVEVKTRRHSKKRNANDLPWVSYKQAERIKKAAKDYMYKIETPKIRYRFDLIEITMGTYFIKNISHWQNNFGFSK
jgi:putative endonuclease